MADYKPKVETLADELARERCAAQQTTGELMSEYKELQGKYDKLRKQCDKLEKKNTELLDFKKAVTPKLMNLTIRARREAAACSPMDISTWDLDSSTGREAKRVE